MDDQEPLSAMDQLRRDGLPEPCAPWPWELAQATSDEGIDVHQVDMEELNLFRWALTLRGARRLRRRLERRAR